MELVNNVLKDCIKNYLVVYFDDILIFIQSLKNHLEYIRKVVLLLIFFFLQM